MRVFEAAGQKVFEFLNIYIEVVEQVSYDYGLVTAVMVFITCAACLVALFFSKKILVLTLRHRNDRFILNRRDNVCAIVNKLLSQRGSGII